MRVKVRVRVWVCERVEILTKKPVMKPTKGYGLRLGLWVKVRVMG